MKTGTFATLLISVVGAMTMPHSKRQDTASIDDTTVLNYALTLEHLEDAFYKQALDRFDEAAFTAAGLPSFARGRFQQVSEHESAHVAFLSAALGDQAVQPCEYDFPYDTPQGFTALSQALEGVGVSAYIGAAQFITNKEYLTAAASVLSTEARHASWVASVVNQYAGWSGPFDVPLGYNQVYSLAAAFITSCPDTNAPLPVTAFPSLTISSGGPGSTVDLTYNASGVADGAPLFVAFYTGLLQEIANVTDGKVTIPDDLRGAVYAVLTTNGTAATDDSIVAGPAILSFEFSSTDAFITQ